MRWIGLLLAVLVSSAGCSKKEAPEVEAAAPVQVAAVTRDTVRRLVEADAILAPVDESAITPKISAPVREFLVRRGDPVRAGQVVAVLENRDLVAAANAAKGQVEQAEANLSSLENAQIPESEVKARTDVQSAQEQFDAAKKVLESRQKLFQDGALARKMVEDQQVVFAQAKAQLETAQEHMRALQSSGKTEQIKSARAQVASAQGQYQAAEAQVAYSRITSPIDGVVADRPLYAGEMAAAGAPLMTVMTVSRVIAKANVPQSQAAAIRVGDPATIRLTDSETEVPGRVTVVSPATDPASTTLQVWVEAENRNGLLKPGATVRVAIVADVIKDAVVVPSSAILPGPEGGNIVLIVGADSVAHQKKVEIGVRDGDKTQVLSGVAPGEQVVTVGGVGVDDSAKVRIVKAGDQDAEDKGSDEKGGGEKE
jgi:HlyD family secretion protein